MTRTEDELGLVALVAVVFLGTLAAQVFPLAWVLPIFLVAFMALVFLAILRP